MESLKEIAHISGKGGLFRILKPGRAGVIVETLDEKKQREMVNMNARVSVLSDISIYTEDHNKSTPLPELFMKMRELHGENIDLDLKNSSTAQLFDFFAEIMPDFDRERVYASDVKKIVQWYNILSKTMPQIFTVEAAETPSEEVAG